MLHVELSKAEPALVRCEQHHLLDTDGTGCPLCAHAERHPEQWQPIISAPKNATTIEVMLKGGATMEAHWASDLSGEEQPPFQGWFIKRGQGCVEIDTPIKWRPKQ